MSEVMYTSDRSIQILIRLLKENKIKKVVASPGTTNAIFVASIQNDPDFELYSSADERSAGYIACGLAQESGEPVIITCTEATASRNYLPALTEAYYRKLPILVITGYHSMEAIGQLNPQSINRSSPPPDTVRLSVNVKSIKETSDDWFVNLQINKAILELTRNGGGPVHINLQSSSKWQINNPNLIETRIIKRINEHDVFPDLPQGRIAIVVGIHRRFTKKLEETIESFCESNNAVVFADNISGYYGKYKINPSILSSQKNYRSPVLNAKMVIHIGEIGAPRINASDYWRVSSDGEVRDSFKKLTYLFDMEEQTFFSSYIGKTEKDNEYYKACKSELKSFFNNKKEIPFSNVWIAEQIHDKIPQPSIIHFGILNSYRSWNFFYLPIGVEGHSNVGGYGIDGGLSTLIGSSLASPDKIHFGVFGDLAFFYDMNSLGNRHIGNNLRILLVNNGKGQEFRNNIHPASQLGDLGDSFVAAAGHFGNKSTDLVKHYSEDLGFEYLSATCKKDFFVHLDKFLNPGINERPIIFEIFTTGADESQALDIMTELKTSPVIAAKKAIKESICKVVGDNAISIIKNTIK